MQRYTNFIASTTATNSTLTVLSNASCVVYIAGTLGAATLYSDNGVTPLANPFLSSATGRIDFYAANGRYDVVVSKTGYLTVTISDIELDDLMAPSGASSVGNTPAGSISATTVQGAINEIVSDLLASSGSNSVGYLPAGTGAVATTVQTKLRESVSVKDFGAVGDGVTDDTAAIQAALNLGVTVYMPTGIYLTTSELVLKTGSKLIGAGAFSAFVNSGPGPSVAPLNDYSVGTTVILYNGAVSATACIVRASSEAVGIEPTNVETRNLINVGLQNITLNGNGKAGIGLYMVRAMNNGMFDSITVTRTTSHAFLVLISFIGSAKRWAAWLNEGCGITLGLNIFSWASGNVTVDEIHFDSCISQYSGHSSTRTPLGGYVKATSYDKEYGIGIGQGRALKFTNLQAIDNGGVGIYCLIDRWPINVDTFYTESNCASDLNIPVNGRFGIWVQGVAASVSRHMQFSNGYMSGAGTTLEYDGVMLQGTEPSRKGEDAVVLKQIPLLKHISASWGNYRLVDCDSSVVTTGTSPYMLGPTYNNQLNLAVTGTAAVVMAAGVITSQVCTGVISSVSVLGTGSFSVIFTANLITAQYVPIAIAQDQRIAYIASKGVGSFTVSVRNVAGAASDTVSLSVAVFGGYTL